jgi:hypothetical protein
MMVSSLEGEEEVFVGGLMRLGTATTSQRTPILQVSMQFISYLKISDLRTLESPLLQLRKLPHSD